MKKRNYGLLALLLIITLIFLSFPSVLSSTIGTLALTVLGDSSSYAITIHSPLNTTYTFNSVGVYSVGLNVSANFTVDKWWYKHEELTHNSIITSSTFFTPNTTINVLPNSNRITVFANYSLDGTIVNSSVVFSVDVPNSAPILSLLANPIFVCESSSLSYNFNATDIDEDSLSFDISPKDPFYARSLGKLNYTVNRANLFSAVLVANQKGNYPVTVSASDGEYVDTQTLNISVIEINNLPSFPNIGVQTIYAQGDGSTLYLTVDVTDSEGGNRTDGNLIFNSTILDGPNIFNISSSGVINYTPVSYSPAVYNIEVCVSDQGIDDIHPNISVCGQDGGSNEVCDTFELTITNQNRPPTIISYSPEVNIETNANADISLSVNAYDPDSTTPDAYWYVDGSLVEYDSGSLTNTLTYNFGCGSSGEKNIQVVITDGVLNDSLTWVVDLNPVVCESSSSGGGGGGSGVGTYCGPEWACMNWNVCESLDIGLDTGLISGVDYRLIKDRCNFLGLEDDRCGYQIRSCNDLNSCNVKTGKPIEFQECVFTENPSCSDGIKNCHGGECELLVDCGGPCSPCATCSDGIKNRGEEGVDCGGPCSRICSSDGSKTILLSDYTYLLWFVLIFFILILIYKLVKVGYMRKRLKE